MKLMTSTTLIAGLLAFSTATSHARSVPYGVHGDAQWFAHADLQALKSTTVGGAVLDRMQAGQAASKLAALSAVMNFDPRSDLEDLTLYGFGKNGDGALILRGTFDAGRLDALAKAGDAYETETYQGHVLHSWMEAKHGRQKRTHGALHADDILVFADDGAVLKRALDVLDGRAPVLSGTDRFPGLDDAPQGGFIFAAANLAGMDSLAPQARMFKAAKGAVLTVGETEGLVYADMVLETPSAEAANNMKKIMDGMTALALMNRERNPAGARMAEKVDAAVDGSRLTVTLWSSVADVLARMEKKQK